MRILIIEDEKGISNFLKKSLISEGFAVDSAYDGESGSFLARTNDYDLVILDYILPKMNGKDVCKEIKEEKTDLPIIMLTVKTEILDKVEMLNLGVDDYLTKPFSFEELLARAKTILKRPPIREKAIYQVKDLILNSDKNIVKKSGKEVYLTRKEFCLLEYFLQNRGNVLSRSMIMEHVWDINADPFSNTIESHILNLRKKIDTKNREQFIKTIPGRGYKLIE